MTPTVPPDSNQISLKIIEAVKQHPVLYCTEIKGLTSRLQEFKQKVWCHISDELRLDPSFVRLKWKNLRDTYCRILKIKNKTEDGPRKKKWIFEDNLSFLKFPSESDYQPQCVELTEQYIQEINSGGISSEGLLEQLEDRIDEDYSEYLEVLEETTANPTQVETDTIEVLDGDEQLVAQSIRAVQDTSQQDIETYVEQVPPKYRKLSPKRMKSDRLPLKTSTPYNVKNSPLKSNNSNLLKTTTLTSAISPMKRPSNAAKKSDTNFDQVLTSATKTSLELFFDSMAQTVKKLPSKAQADIKMNICKIVTEAEIRYSNQIGSQNTQQLASPRGAIPKLVLIPCNMIDNENKN